MDNTLNNTAKLELCPISSFKQHITILYSNGLLPIATVMDDVTTMHSGIGMVGQHC